MKTRSVRVWSNSCHSIFDRNTGVQVDKNRYNRSISVQIRLDQKRSIGKSKCSTVKKKLDICLSLIFQVRKQTDPSFSIPLLQSPGWMEAIRLKIANIPRSEINHQYRNECKFLHILDLIFWSGIAWTIVEPDSMVRDFCRTSVTEAFLQPLFSHYLTATAACWMANTNQYCAVWLVIKWPIALSLRCTWISLSNCPCLLSDRSIHILPLLFWLKNHQLNNKKLSLHSNGSNGTVRCIAKI